MIRTRRLSDGSYVRVMPDGSQTPAPKSKTDWDKVDAMSDDEVMKAARSDPDAQPVTAKRQKKMARVSQIKVIRRALRLTQEEFSSKFHIPLGTLRDWEQKRSEPDQAAKAYLKVIAKDANAVLKALDAAA